MNQWSFKNVKIFAQEQNYTIAKLKDDKSKQYELKKQTNTGITFYMVFT